MGRYIKSRAVFILKAKIFIGIYETAAIKISIL